MTITAATVSEYLQLIPEDYRIPFTRLRKTILAGLPQGFEEIIAYNMPSYVVPHSLYPPGYHTDPNQPLPYLSIAVQKHFIGYYHFGIYAVPELKTWFEERWNTLNIGRLDMGKSCIRLKKNQIPYELMGELAGKISVQEWIDIYESTR